MSVKARQLAVGGCFSFDRNAEMLVSQIGHDLIPVNGAAVFEHCCESVRPDAHRKMMTTPDRDLGKDRRQGDRFLGQAVDDLLFVSGVAGAR